MITVPCTRHHSTDKNKHMSDNRYFIKFREPSVDNDLDIVAVINESFSQVGHVDI